jgi:hypothetical protein
MAQRARLGACLIMLMVPLTMMRAAPASAADCGQLKILNSVDLVQTPIRAMIPVALNGNKRMFLLDTGGSISQITAAGATDLGLHMEEAPLKLLDSRGNAARKAVRIEKFQIGHQIGSTWLAVNPDPEAGKSEGWAGLYATDLMGPFDIELDFSASKMNVFDQDHCDGRVIYWPTQAVGVLPISFYRQQSLRFPVTLDGKQLVAEMDTGAPNLTMPYSAAERLFDWKPDDPKDVVIGEGGGHKVYGHIFSTLDFQGVIVRNPHVVIHPDLIGTKDANNAQQTGNRARMDDYVPDIPDILIGLDVLKRLHLYIAFKEKKIYITPGSSTPVTPAAAQAQH